MSVFVFVWKQKQTAIIMATLFLVAPDGATIVYGLPEGKPVSGEHEGAEPPH